ncbi:AraC family transcriptional regulator [Streptomyces microflavus]|uniref:helix-turn-helix domain-containing protein n=1 Tax=Streptomyces TaxID=1883 RepID=UPI000823EFAC|nr:MULTISPECIES: AraC family transcriptional regulator [Streptomyces]MCX4650828.1 AraC family transcriptional regulator [Streptomyces microflavus]SCK28545.1 AraC-type DNA-binding protein [Streptomyces sp. ScaeMP-e48]
MSVSVMAPGRGRGEMLSTALLRWSEPSVGGPVVETPYLLTTAVLDSPAPAGSSTSGVHTHDDALLVWPHVGSTTLHTRNTVRRLVPGQGVWMPPGTPHASHPDPGSVSCYTYVTRAAIPPHWTSPRSLRMGRALQEMLLHLDANAMPDDRRLRAQRLIIEMLEEDPHAAMEVPVPEDPRIRAMAEDIMRDPESDLSLEEWAARHALSVRTVTRAFGRDVGMPFTRWRSLVRMSAATTLLAQGRPVNLVAHRCGYSTTSAFSAAFRRVTGTSPTAYLREQSALAPAGH